MRSIWPVSVLSSTGNPITKMRVDVITLFPELVEQVTGAPCLFLLAPCGDIGPKYGFVGDAEVADRNGRQLAYAALAVLEGLPQAGDDYHYQGPTLSGATIGVRLMTWGIRLGIYVGRAAKLKR